MGIAFVCTMTLLFSAVSAKAEDAASLEQKTAGLQAELDGINQEMKAISDEIASTEMRSATMSAEIQRSQDSLNEALAQEEEQYEDMKTRIKFLYENGNTSLLELLFSAETMTDFLNKADFVENISDYDQEMLDKLSTIRKDIEDKQNILKEQQGALTGIQKDLNIKKEELQKKAEATSTDLESYTAQLKQLQAANAPNTSGICDGRVTNTAAMNVSADEVTLLAAILQCEAYQDYNSLLAVATVILNRVNDPRFPNSVSGVVYAEGQFEPVMKGGLDKVLAEGPSALSRQVAQDALNGVRLASVADCCYFLYAGATDIPGVNVGNNLFFRSWPQ